MTTQQPTPAHTGSNTGVCYSILSEEVIESLRLYAIVRADIDMSPGKTAAQAGHAYLGAFLSASNHQNFKTEFLHYAKLVPGTKVCLQANIRQIYEIQEKCRSLNIPNFLVVDSGCQNFYEGKPIVTALGIGPLTKNQAKPVVSKLRLYK